MWWCGGMGVGGGGGGRRWRGGLVGGLESATLDPAASIFLTDPGHGQGWPVTATSISAGFRAAQVRDSN